MFITKQISKLTEPSGLTVPQDLSIVSDTLNKVHTDIEQLEKELACQRWLFDLVSNVGFTGLSPLQRELAKIYEDRDDTIEQAHALALLRFIYQRIQEYKEEDKSA